MSLEQIKQEIENIREKHHNDPIVRKDIEELIDLMTLRYTMIFTGARKTFQIKE